MLDNLGKSFSNVTGGGYVPLLVFGFTIAAIIYLALIVEKSANTIILKTKLGASFVGGLLLAVISSVPEFVTEVSQSSSGNPTTAVSSELGSNSFSIFLIFITSAFLFVKGKDILSKTDKGPVIILVQGIIMASITLVGIYFGDIKIGSKEGYGIGLIPILLFLIFISSNIISYKLGLNEDTPEENRNNNWTLKKSIIIFVIAGLGIAGLALVLNIGANGIAYGFEFNDESTGGVFLAIATSSTEIIMFIILIMNKQYVMGLATLVGSHVFNLGLIFFGDLSYSSGAYFNHEGISGAGAWAITTIGLSLILLLGIYLSTKLLKNKPRYKWINFSLSLFAILGYVSTLAISFTSIIS